MSAAPRLFAVSDHSRKRPRDEPPAYLSQLVPSPPLSPQPLACLDCTYLNEGACVLCEMCGSELPLSDQSAVPVARAAVHPTASSALQQLDDEPITIDDDEAEGEAAVDEEAILIADDEPVAFENEALSSSSSPPPQPLTQPPRHPNHNPRMADIPPPLRASNGDSARSYSPTSTTAFSSAFFASSSSASSSTSYPAPAPSILLPLSYMHLPTLPFVSPLSSALLSTRRFATAQRKGEMALLCAQLLIDNRIDTQLLSPLLACLCRLGAQYRVQQLPVAYSMEVYEREVSYDEYKQRHERLVEEKEDGKAVVDGGKPPLDTLTSPLSATFIPTLFLLIAPRIFCRMYGSRQLHAQLGLLEARAKELQQTSSSSEAHNAKDEDEDDSAKAARYQSPFSVHIVLWGLVSLVAQQKQERKDYRAAAATSSAPSAPPPTLPFPSVSSLGSLSSLWLRSGGVCQVEFHHPSPADAVSALLLHIRHTASARYKRRDEDNMFVFGSLRVVKGRTAAMRGANPLPRRQRKRRRNEQSAHDHGSSGSSGSSTDDSDDAAEPVSAAADSSSAAAVLLSYSESWIHMLCMITGVSEERAAVISRHYPTVRALTDAYQSVHSSTQREYVEWKQHSEREVGQQQPKKGKAGRLIVAPGETDEAAVARIANERASVLLADLMCGQRRLGDELSKRVYITLMT